MIPERFWHAVEAIHDVVYFGDDHRFERLGLRGFWRGYFASRAAALGTPSPELVTATFFGFEPAMVARTVPEVWSLADRDVVLAERSRFATELLTSAWPEPPALVDDVAALVAGLDLAGKPLAAAHASLPAPSDPVGRLWHAATVLRELHGDVHVAVLVADGVDGCAANAWAVACGLAPSRLREVRGWSQEQWATASDELRARGWVDDADRATPEGLAARDDVERRTHAAAERALSPTARRDAAALTGALVALARPLADSGLLPYPNPTAVVRP